MKNKNKYSMSKDMKTTHNHPHYSYLLSAEQNVRLGNNFAKKHHKNKLWVYRSLEQLTNLTHKKVYKEASELAFNNYVK